MAIVVFFFKYQDNMKGFKPKLWKRVKCKLIIKEAENILVQKTSKTEVRMHCVGHIDEIIIHFYG